MNIGVPREIKEQENRVAVIPGGVYVLTKKGHKVFVEKNAGASIGYSDEEYKKAGATIVEKHEDVFKQADLIVKVKEPLPSEYGLFRPGQLLFTYLHLAASKSLTEELAKTKMTGIAYETVALGKRLPLLEPMSEVAGRMGPLMALRFLAKHEGGNGVLLSGVPGVLPGKVMVLGAGTSGINAARVAFGLGAKVTVYDIDMEKLRHVDINLPGVRTMYSNIPNILELLPTVDIVIGAVLLPGAKAPRLITREMLKTMKPGSVIVDISIDQGGCIETSRPTSHKDPVYVEENVIHYCVANMPGAYARTSTQALSNVTLPYVEVLANGLKEACKLRPELIGGINLMDGHVTNEGVAQAHNMPFVDPATLVK
jgi:alanine dehydrogenase